VVTEQYARATRFLTENRDTLGRVAEALLEHEVLDASQQKQLMAGEAIEPKVVESAPPPPVREVRDEEGEQGMGGLLPPPVAAPKPTS
jgi:cell division protease FtsH